MKLEISELDINSNISSEIKSPNENETKEVNTGVTQIQFSTDGEGNDSIDDVNINQSSGHLNGVIRSNDVTDAGPPLFQKIHIGDLEKRLELSLFKHSTPWNYEWIVRIFAGSISLANVWRFPNLALQHGGSAFLWAYFLTLIVLAQPLCFLELSLGQFTSGNIISTWSCLPVLKGLIVSQKVVTVFLALLFGAITSYSLQLAYQSATGYFPEYPWFHNCKDTNESRISNNATMGPPLNSTDYNAMLTISNQEMVVSLLVVWIIVCIILLSPRLPRKFSVVCSILPTVALLACLAYCIYKNYADTGIETLFIPDLKMLKNVQLWYDAVQQALFSSGIGFGYLIMLSQYNDFEHNVLRDSIIFCVTDFLLSIISCSIVFIVIGSGNLPFKAFETGVKFNLSLDIYWCLLSSIETGGLMKFCCTCFFLIISLLGVGNLIPILDCLFPRADLVEQKYLRRRKIIITFSCIAIFCVSLVFSTELVVYLISALNSYAIGGTLLTIVVVECIGLMWIYGVKEFSLDLEFMFSKPVKSYFKYIWTCLAPVGLSVLFFYHQLRDEVESEEITPYWAYIFGWILYALCLLQILLWAVVVYQRNDEYGLGRKLMIMFKPDPKWGPSDPHYLFRWRAAKEERRKRVPSRISIGQQNHVNESYVHDQEIF